MRYNPVVRFGSVRLPFFPHPFETIHGALALSALCILFNLLGVSDVLINDNFIIMSHDKYVIGPADKAANYVAFVCKTYYMFSLNEELGLKLHRKLYICTQFVVSGRHSSNLRDVSAFLWVFLQQRKFLIFQTCMNLIIA